jgi:hypothetical protein
MDELDRANHPRRVSLRLANSSIHLNYFCASTICITNAYLQKLLYRLCYTFHTIPTDTTQIAYQVHWQGSRHLRQNHRDSGSPQRRQSN